MPSFSLCLISEGVLTCKKDPFLPKHPLIDVPNLHVMKLLQSLKSRGHIHEIFAWRNYYFTLTDSVRCHGHRC